MANERLTGPPIHRTTIGTGESTPATPADGKPTTRTGTNPADPATPATPPAPTGSEQALRELNSGGIRVVLEGVGSSLERAIKTLEKADSNVAQVAAPLRSALKQLEQLTGPWGAETRPALGELSALAHRLLEATIAKPNADRHLGTTPLELSNRVAELSVAPIFEELAVHNPAGKKAIEELLALTGQGDALLRELARMYPGAEAFGGSARLVAKLDRDLGALKTELSARMEKQGVSPEDQERFFRAFAEVRQAFEIGSAKGDDYQRTNWVHTRIEVLHTLQAAEVLKLNPRETVIAMLGALASDAFKDASTFSLLWHNRGGGDLVLPLIVGRNFPEMTPARVQDARRVAIEHQITPPLFMSSAMKGFLGAQAPGVDEIFKHIDQPNDAPQKGGEVSFSSDAFASLRAKGIPGWAVLDPESRNYRASIAAIVGDVLQYPGYDGVIKYAHDIRDPEESRAYLRDDLIHKAVNSSLEFSFGQGMKVVEDVGLQRMASEYQRAMKAEIEGVVYPRVHQRLCEALGVGPEAKILYWNEPVTVPLKDGERKVIDLVKRTLAEVAAEAGRIPLDPFGHVARRNQV